MAETQDTNETQSEIRQIMAAIESYDGPRTARGLPTADGLSDALGFHVTAAARNEAIDLAEGEADAIPPETSSPAPSATRAVLYALSPADEAAIAEQRRAAGVPVWAGEFAAGTRYPAKITSEPADGGHATLRVSLDGRGSLGRIVVEAPEGEGPGTYAVPA